jgi:RNA polymerase sigma-70 factor (ECF subfamily)
LGPQTADEQLMLAFKSGDARAFATLVSRHRQPVFNFILRYVGHRQRAEDLLQETWLKVVRSSSEWEPKARFTTWVYTIARNLCVDSARKETFRATDSLDAPASADEGTEGRTKGELVADEAAATPDRGAHNAAAAATARTGDHQSCRRSSERCSCCASTTASASRRSPRSLG